MEEGKEVGEAEQSGWASSILFCIDGHFQGTALSLSQEMCCNIKVKLGACQPCSIPNGI
jgi:hypothetical protein